MSRCAFRLLEQEFEEDYLQIYEIKTRQLITGIEIISPGNKSAKQARRALSSEAEKVPERGGQSRRSGPLAARTAFGPSPEVRSREAPAGRLRDQHHARRQPGIRVLPGGSPLDVCRVWGFHSSRASPTSYWTCRRPWRESMKRAPMRCASTTIASRIPPSTRRRELG